MDEKIAFPLVLSIVTILGAVSLIIIISDSNTSGNVAVATAQKSRLGILGTAQDCKFPNSVVDLIEFLSERKNVPFSSDSCPWIAQDFCVVLNSGACLRECLKIVQSPDGVCGSSSFSSQITAQVVLSPEECKRLALSYDVTTTKSLSKVGAGVQQTQILNTCSGVTEPAAVKVYSADAPMQAYARNLFETGDITGYLVDQNNDQPALEYVLCSDGRARVNIEGRNRCNAI